VFYFESGLLTNRLLLLIQNNHFTTTKIQTPAEIQYDVTHDFVTIDIVKKSV